MSHFIDSLKWRYAVKKFDSKKDISENQLSEILEATQLSASSYGLQPYKVIIIKDRKMREQLVEHSYQQRQVADSSHLMVFCANLNVDDNYIDHFIDLNAKARGMEASQLAEYAGMMKGTLGQMDEQMKLTWMAKQAYIAHGNVLAATAHMEIDSCPMEGFDSAKYDEILGLTELGLKSLVLLPIGFRAEDDGYQHLPKVRFPQEELFVTM